MQISIPNKRFEQHLKLLYKFNFSHKNFSSKIWFYLYMRKKIEYIPIKYLASNIGS